MSIKIWDSGPANSETLVFFHGFPDDASMWNLQVAYLEKKYRCIRPDLPNFGDSIDDPAGFSFDTVVDKLNRALNQHKPALPEKFTLVVHDWGAIYGYIFAQKFSNRINRIVALDIGASIKMQPNPLGYFLIPAYQLGLASAFIATKIPAVGVALAGAATTATLTGLSLFGNEYAGPTRRTPMSPYLNYPYYYFWKDAMAGKLKMEYDLPGVPFMFAYGTQGVKKWMMFHDEEWLKRIQSEKQNRVVAFEQSGHWLMRDEPGKLNREIEAFLET